jgi:hypothetical protein
MYFIDKKCQNVYNGKVCIGKEYGTMKEIIRKIVCNVLVFSVFFFTLTFFQKDAVSAGDFVKHQHAFVLHTEMRSTCENDGLKIFTCDCGAVDFEELDKLAHTLTIVEAQQATCTEKGWEAYEMCENCDYTTYQEIPERAHNFMTEVLAKADCTTNGLALKICLDCAQTYSEIVISKGHVWDEGQDWYGVMLYTCKNCGAEKTLGSEHVHEYIYVTILQNATCEREGTKRLSCECGESILQTFKGEHVYENGLCIDCGRQENNTSSSTDNPSGSENNNPSGSENNNPLGGENNNPNGNENGNQNGNGNQGGTQNPSDPDENKKELTVGELLYELNEEETAYTCIGVEADSMDCAEIIIPDTYNNLPVVAIAQNAFMQMYRLNRVTIGANIKKVGKYAFYDCPNIIEVYNRSSVSKNNLGGLKYFEKGYYTAEYESQLLVDENGFVTYMDGTNCCLVGYVGTEKELAIPDGVTKICGYVFCDFNVEKIFIPASVQEIEYGAFKDSALQRAEFENTNGWFCDGGTVHQTNLQDPALAAEYLKANFVWTR